MNITNAEYRIKIVKGSQIVNQRTGVANTTCKPIYTWAARDQDSGCMIFDYCGSSFYVQERNEYVVMPEGRQMTVASSYA